MATRRRRCAACGAADDAAQQNKTKQNDVTRLRARTRGRARHGRSRCTPREPALTCVPATRRTPHALSACGAPHAGRTGVSRWRGDRGTVGDAGRGAQGPLLSRFPDPTFCRVPPGMRSIHPHRCHLCGWIEHILGGTPQNDGQETSIMGGRRAAPLHVSQRHGREAMLGVPDQRPDLIQVRDKCRLLLAGLA